MQTAWESRDSVRIDSVYAIEYQGSSLDQGDPNSGTLRYAKSDEVRVVGEMARSLEIVAVDMNLSSPSTWFFTHNASDPPGWVTVTIRFFTITVDLSNMTTHRASTADRTDLWLFDFTLKPIPDSASPTDTTWQVVRWNEVRPDK